MGKIIAAFAVVVALLLFALPRPAHTQATFVTAHQFAISLKIASQGFSHGEQRPKLMSVNTKDLFDECVGSRPARNEAIYLFMSCPDYVNTNMIAAINT